MQLHVIFTFNFDFVKLILSTSMKIAYIGIKGLPSKGGAERVVKAIVQRLANRHEITVYCSRRYTPKNTKVPGMRIIRVPGLSGKHTHMTSVDLTAACHAVLYGDYDLIHLHNIEASFVLPLLRLKYPVATTAHGRITSDSKWSKMSATIMQSMVFPFALLSDAATSVSLPDAQELMTRFRCAISYIPNGIDPSPDIDVEAGHRLLRLNNVPDQDYILFVAGRVIPLKGAHLLLEAFQRVECQSHLLMVGDLSHLPKYTNKLRSMSDSRVRFIPFISLTSELFGVMRLSRFFVFPSINEAMSMALLEAASFAIPIVCSDIPANTAVLPEHAVHFRSGDAKDLCEKLNWAIEYPKEMKEMGLKAQAWVKKEFSWDVIAERYDRLYRSILK